MNLPDYNRCVDFVRLHVAMGIRSIPTVPPIALEEAVALREIRELPYPEDAATDVRLQREAIPVWKQEVVDRANEPLHFRGRSVCVYVRDQYDSVTFGGTWRRYFYHLFYCRALQRLNAEDEKANLLATRRPDGVFEVHSSSQKALAKLDLCADCREVLKKSGQNPFDLQGFFEDHDAYEMRKLREVAPVLQTTDRSDFADVCRRVCDFSCQACGVICVDVPGLLHLHYDDGDPTHINADNLHVLCVDCHASLSGHDHMKMQPVVQADIEVVERFRRQQGIVSLGLGFFP